MERMKIIVDLSDPAFYAGLEELMEELGAVESDNPQEADRKVKALLLETFPGCDFGEGSVFALTESGETALEDFLEGLAPKLSAGAEKCVDELVQRAKAQAEARRRAL